MSVLQHVKRELLICCLSVSKDKEKRVFRARVNRADNIGRIYCEMPQLLALLSFTVSLLPFYNDGYVWMVIRPAVYWSVRCFVMRMERLLILFQGSSITLAESLNCSCLCRNVTCLKNMPFLFYQSKILIIRHFICTLQTECLVKGLCFDRIALCSLEVNVPVTHFTLTSRGGQTITSEISQRNVGGFKSWKTWKRFCCFYHE